MSFKFSDTDIQQILEACRQLTGFKANRGLLHNFFKAINEDPNTKPELKNLEMDDFKYTCAFCGQQKTGHPWLTSTYLTAPFDRYDICADCQVPAQDIWKAELANPNKVKNFRLALESHLRKVQS